MTSHVRGSNYVVIKDIKDLYKYLVQDFEYLFFPIATNITLEVTTPNIKFERIVGSGNEGIEEITEKIRWNLEKHKYYSYDFKEKIFLSFIIFQNERCDFTKTCDFSFK